MKTENIMNINVIANYSKLKLSLFILPLFLLLTIVLLLYGQGTLNGHNYIQIQKDAFFYINCHLGHYPNIVYNLTQLGDDCILLSFLTIFILYAPKIWETLLSVLLVSLMFSYSLKNVFSIPRPATVFDNNSFIIIGKTATGFASLPSGHSITVFSTIAVLLFAFMPEKRFFKILWIFSVVGVGIIIVFTRVGERIFLLTLL